MKIENVICLVALVIGAVTLELCGHGTSIIFVLAVIWLLGP